ncbi:MAG: ABC transporter ATP-binding protein [Oscillospiraceae bacterium]|nr:ABC transporter ATP-binding protein [Oscillospiraceae bacterium]
MSKVLELKNIEKTFYAGTVNENYVIKNLSLDLEDGDYVTVIGGNGAGKSTMLNIISGALLPDSGSVTIDGEDVTKLKEYQRAKYLGRVFQDPRLGTATNMSIAENMAIANRRGKNRGLKWGLPKSEEAEYKELLSILDLGLENRLDAKMGLLSGGQRQAVTLLMATIQRPKILLLDEHTAALDPKTAAKVLEITDKIVTQNKLTTVMITHNMRDAIKHGNRLVMLDAGRVILDIRGEEKQNLTVDQLLKKFEHLGGESTLSDRMLLG